MRAGIRQQQVWYQRIQEEPFKAPPPRSHFLTNFSLLERPWAGCWCFISTGTDPELWSPNEGERGGEVTSKWSIKCHFTPMSISVIKSTAQTPFSAWQPFPPVPAPFSCAIHSVWRWEGFFFILLPPPSTLLQQGRKRMMAPHWPLWTAAGTSLPASSFSTHTNVACVKNKTLSGYHKI